jgi:hypothetical protein
MAELGEPAELQPLRERIAERLLAVYPIRPILLAGPPPPPGTELHVDSARYGLGDVAPQDVRVALAEPTGDIVIVSRGRILVLAGDDLTVRAAVELPEALPFGAPGDAFFSTQDAGDLRLYLWEAEAHRLAALQLRDGALHIDGLHDLSPSLGRAKGPQGTRSLAFDAARRQLLVLDLSRKAGRSESRLTAIDADEGRPRHTESYNVGLFSLVSLAGTPHHVATRLFDPMQRRMSGWFHAAVLEERGRVTEKWVFDELEEEIYAFRQVARSPGTGRTYGQYWYIHPLTGQVAGDGRSVLFLKEDRKVFYHAHGTSLFLEDGQSAVGAMHLHCQPDGSDLLLQAWRGGDGDAGVVVIGGTDARPRGHVRYGAEWRVGAIRTDLQRRRAFAVLFRAEGGGFVVRRFEPGSAR